MLEHAIAAIEDDPAWQVGRFVAPADSKTPGAMVDLSVPGHAIIYRVADRGAVVRILVIQPIAF